MARYPGATWQPLGRNQGPALNSPLGVTLHHQAGSGNPLNVYLARGVSAHFWIRKDGRVWQHVDTSMQSWHGMSLNARWIGVETEGCGAPPHSEPLTTAQINAFGDLMRWANRTHGIPLQLSNNATTRGLNYHRVAVATGCPCAVRVNQRTAILNRAKGGGSVSTGKGPYRHEANGRESINDVAQRRNTTVANLIEVSFGKGALSDANRIRFAKYLAWPGRDKPMDRGMPYWTRNP
jgi:hypothetical protein